MASIPVVGTHPKRRPILTELTSREREVCDLIVHGCSNKELGNRLGISRRTAEDHRANMFKKLGVRNAVELVRKVYHLDELEGAK
jgi:DNA-binding NarL/FixJ family response regulator